MKVVLHETVFMEDDYNITNMPLSVRLIPLLLLIEVTALPCSTKYAMRNDITNVPCFGGKYKHTGHGLAGNRHSPGMVWWGSQTHRLCFGGEYRQTGRGLAGTYQTIAVVLVASRGLPVVIYN